MAVSFPRRGEVVRVRLDPTVGSEQAGERPAIVISPNLINEHSSVVLIASLTSKRTESVYPFEVLIEPPEAGLTMRSKVRLMQLRSIDKSRIFASYGVVSEAKMLEIEEALRIATGLTRLD